VSPLGFSLYRVKETSVLRQTDRIAVLDDFEPRLPRQIQLEGAAFSLRRRVTIAAATGRSVHAVVRGARPYDVIVALSPEEKVHVACDCVPFLEDGLICRHIWAALVKIQNDGLLEPPSQAPEVERGRAERNEGALPVLG
jgi:uncharacterized Zn finger protein